MNNHPSTLCIGGGPAGLSAAYRLSKSGYPVTVIDLDPKNPGGISRTEKREGFGFDIGGHRFFSKSEEITQMWQEILGEDLIERSRKSRIYYDGDFYPYPLDTLVTVKNLGVIESLRCLLSYLYARLFPHPNPRTFEDWVINHFGRRLYTIFFQTYTEKVWGQPCDTIAADWAAQRIKGLSLSVALKNALQKTLGILPGQGKVKTLITHFLYPRLGPGMMWERTAEIVRENGGIFHQGYIAHKIAYDKAQQKWEVACKTTSGSEETLAADRLINSMPLRELIAMLPDVPTNVKHAAESLSYRDFLTVALVVKERNSFDDNWLYIHDPEVKVGRIQNYKSWSAEMVPDAKLNCYGMEYFCFEGDGLWNSTDSELVSLAGEELVTLGLVKKDDIEKGFVVRQHKAYPVYDRSYRENVLTIRHWLERAHPTLQTVGRNGMHKYNNQDHSMMTALLAAENIMTGEKKYDIWQVNQDAEYHEAGSSGSASGERLVPVQI